MDNIQPMHNPYESMDPSMLGSMRMSLDLENGGEMTPEYGGRRSLRQLERVAVLGTGAYGAAFAERLVQSNSGVEVVMGSRRKRIDPRGFPLPCEVMSYEDAVAGADIVVIAVRVEDHATVVERLGNRLDGVIIVDVSNSPPKTVLGGLRERFTRGDSESSNKSIAKNLERELKANEINADVVKAFNNISAYTLSQPRNNPGATTKACMISGDSESAKSAVALMARRMGFDVMHLGDLDAAKGQEGAVHSFFEGWKIACTIGLVLTFIFLLYITIAYWVAGPLSWMKYPTKAFLIVTGDVSAGLLAFTFLPGPIAAFWQIFRGTATRPFPAWFGTWLGIRKQLGLLAFVVAIPHVIMACKGDEPTELQIENQLAPVFGIIAFVLFFVMSSCSNTTVSGHFTWAEFRFVFVYIGYGVVSFTLAHVVCVLVIQLDLVAEDNGYTGAAPLCAIYLTAILGLAMLLKFVVSVPPLNGWVNKIRNHQKLDLLPSWLRKDIKYPDGNVKDDTASCNTRSEASKVSDDLGVARARVEP
uniref:Pyrroline-5-carboxylate reductase catalytic N-terminal domain-containing protein n=1 Tax=Rhodosorus marinus TaxID=101924 RepID=A0A7S2ZIU6_9RHOD|mmetsp:Transcript_20978/g.85513  ORF Transcript_20978/g.85513 Transcript_20978/m.85513 type:complete len:531 (+) Transcript_20978:441-2033(+)|eukprot:CAMPEP_0113965186 /NCGR_PEP_ID=MMETSP0011_2-20120614/7602_1 /TAXON_ID=101924 /ORGANISM="Rhodosorus marinus" /LENGTH=530 /DNA_ID=CAMNT_0000977665 /DNA_START=352 /DNA_END=1944 /DNA_ORIENTATION=+ /assembly_acc=CAM_ASM_000156